MKFLYRNLSPRQLVVMGLAVPMVCMLVIGWLQWQSVKDMLSSRQVVRQIRATQLALGIFRYSLSDAESCQLRYVLTHSEVNIGPYHKLVADSKDQFKVLRSSTADNPTLESYLDQIEPLLNDKIAVMERSFALEASGDHAGALQTVGAEETGAKMIKIEAAVDAMEFIESQLIFKRQSAYQHNFKLNTVLSALSMALCLGFLAAILLLLRRLAHLQSKVTLKALSEMIDYQGGKMTIEEYLQHRRDALEKHGSAQVEAERILGLLEKKDSR